MKIITLIKNSVFIIFMCANFLTYSMFLETRDAKKNVEPSLRKTVLKNELVRRLSQEGLCKDPVKLRKSCSDDLFEFKEQQPDFERLAASFQIMALRTEN